MYVPKAASKRIETTEYMAVSCLITQVICAIPRTMTITTAGHCLALTLMLSHFLVVDIMTEKNNNKIHSLYKIIILKWIIILEFWNLARNSYKKFFNFCNFCNLGYYFLAQEKIQD
jgi:hypothetical protein